MNANDFAFWLNGFVELNKGKMPDDDQWKSIKEHLQLVFTKVTPPVGHKFPFTDPWNNPVKPVLPYEVTCKVDTGDGKTVPIAYEQAWPFRVEDATKITTYC